MYKNSLMGFIQINGRVNIIVRIHHMDANKTRREER